MAAGSPRQPAHNTQYIHYYGKQGGTANLEVLLVLGLRHML